MIMEYKVRIQPSGREYIVHENESLLSAGLRSGLNLTYNCANGSCGECRLRVIDGEVERIRPHDFVIGAAQQAAGVVLGCCSEARSDLEIEALEVECAGEIRHQELIARVAGVERLQTQYMILHLRTPRSRTLQFLAGQYLSLELPGLGSRCLGIASCPCDGLNLRFHLQYSHGDAFSDFAFQRLKRGQQLSVNGPHGDFTLDERDHRPLLFVVSGTGFAPVKSLIEHAIALELEQPIHLYWLSDQPHGHYLVNYCHAWADALDTFSYQCLTLAPAGALSARQAVREMLSAHSQALDYNIFLSLDAPTRALFIEGLGHLGVGQAQLHIDSFLGTCMN